MSADKKRGGGALGLIDRRWARTGGLALSRQRRAPDDELAEGPT